VIQAAPSKRVTPVARNDWWRSPLALAAGALLVGIALGLTGRIRAQRAHSDTASEIADSSPPRAYQPTAVGTSDREFEPADTDHT
jgi:hypothetical protein